MDIARLGVVIDPTPAEQGATRVKQAVRSMGDAAVQETKKTEASTKQATESVKKLGDETQQAGTKAQGGFRKMADAARASAQDSRSGIYAILEAFGLLDGRLGQMVRRIEAIWQSFGAARSATGPVREATEATTALGASMGGAGRAAGMMAGGLNPVTAAVIAVTVALVAATAGVIAFWKAFQAGLPDAAKYEQYQSRIAFSMGSWEKGMEKFRQGKKFAADTPFTDDEVFQSVTTLETMTKGALTTREALDAIGGSAAQAGQGFNVMSEQVGIVFNGLKYGGDVIEQLKTMMSRGVIGGETLQQIRKLGEEAEASGDKTANAAKQWELVFNDLKKNAGALDILSKTWTGLTSTLEGNWTSVKAAFSEPIMLALKPVLVELIKLMGDLEGVARSAGNSVANTFKAVFVIFKEGRFAEAMMASLQDMALFAPKIFAKMAMTLGIFLKENIMAALDVLSNPAAIIGFAKNIGNAMLEAVKGLGEALQKAAEDFLLKMKNGFAEFWNSNVAGIDILGNKPFGQMAMQTPAPQAAKAAPSFMSIGEAWNATDINLSANRDAMFEQMVKDYDAKYAVNLPELEPKSAGMAVDTTTDAIDKQKESIEDLRTNLTRLTDEWTNLEIGADQTLTGITQGISGSMTDAISSAIKGTKSWGDAFREMGDRIIETIIEMITQMWVQYAVGLLVKSVTSYAGVPTTYSAPSTGAVLHSGGIVGDGNAMRAAGPAMRLHSGGMATSEQPAILEKGETVLTRQQSEGIRRNLREQPSQQGTNGQNLTIVNVTDSREILDVIARNPDAILNAISRQAPKVRAILAKGGGR